MPGYCLVSYSHGLYCYSRDFLPFYRQFRDRWASNVLFTDGKLKCLLTGATRLQQWRTQYNGKLVFAIAHFRSRVCQPSTAILPNLGTRHAFIALLTLGYTHDVFLSGVSALHGPTSTTLFLLASLMCKRTDRGRRDGQHGEWWQDDRCL